VHPRAPSSRKRQRHEPPGQGDNTSQSKTQVPELPPMLRQYTFPGLPAQVTQAMPFSPQAADVLPAWQVPPAQQPLGQLLGVQEHTPATHSSPVQQAVPAGRFLHWPVPASHVWQRGQGGVQVQGPQSTGVPQLFVAVAHLPAHVWAVASGTH
jgi:hypothetical protein